MIYDTMLMPRELNDNNGWQYPPPQVPHSPYSALVFLLLAVTSAAIVISLIVLLIHSLSTN